MHGVDNIDNGGVITNSIGTLRNPTQIIDDDPIRSNNLVFTKPSDDDPDTDDDSSKNVGELTIDNAEPVAFNHLSGHFTEALTASAAGGSDQTASWGGAPVIRPAVNDTANTTELDDYSTLTGTTTSEAGFGGRLAEKDAGGIEAIMYNRVDGYFNVGDNAGDDQIQNGNAFNRGINDGGLVLPATHGGSMDQTHQIMLLLSAADDFGDRMIGKGGDYKLIAAMTGYDVILYDNMGNPMMGPDNGDTLVFGGPEATEEEKMATTKIIVNGISVMVDAEDCDGTPIDGPWSLANLTSLAGVSTGASGDFGGLETMGTIKFMRTGLKCEMKHGDGDISNLEAVENPDGVPVEDTRTYSAGTLIVEENNSERSFVTTGQALLKFLTPTSTFAASWSLKSRATPDDVPRDEVDPTGDDSVTVPSDLTTGRDELTAPPASS